jgi:hypothetical protein
MVPLDALTKLVKGKEVHQLREDRPASIHLPSPSARMQEYGME